MLPLLRAEEPAACELVNAAGRNDIVLLCDHASNRIPLQLDNLGLTNSQLDSHIAWDIGASCVARELAVQLDAPLILGNYSRLVIDCNRYPGNKDSIATSSDGIRIPGNQGLAKASCQQRRRQLFDAYHAGIDDLLNDRAGRVALLLSIHSFTPVMNGLGRPWPIGVCYAEEHAQAGKWHKALQKQLHEPVGDNQPYSIEPEVDYTLPVHGLKHGIEGIMLEIRQDTITNPSQARKWAQIIARATWKNQRSQSNLN